VWQTQSYRNATGRKIGLKKFAKFAQNSQKWCAEFAR